MLNIERALRQERLLGALTGLHRKGFDALLPRFSTVYEQTSPAQPRQRAVGGGRQAPWQQSPEKLFFLLFDFKCYPTFELAGLRFERHRAPAHSWMHRLQPVGASAFGKKMVLPERQLDSMEDFLERFPAVKRVLIDGSTRPIQPPQDPEPQTMNYAGKKKYHTRKHLVAVAQTKGVLVFSKAREAKLHDNRFDDEDEIAGNLPDEIPLEVDLGCPGGQKQYDNIYLPHKKPRGGELSAAQKPENPCLSQFPVLCEHAFALCQAL